MPANSCGPASTDTTMLNCSLAHPAGGAGPPPFSPLLGLTHSFHLKPFQRVAGSKGTVKGSLRLLRHQRNRMFRRHVLMCKPHSASEATESATSLEAYLNQMFG
jgi:hypothetical protein